MVLHGSGHATQTAVVLRPSKVSMSASSHILAEQPVSLKLYHHVVLFHSILIYPYILVFFLIARKWSTDTKSVVLLPNTSYTRCPSPCQSLSVSVDSVAVQNQARSTLNWLATHWVARCFQTTMLPWFLSQGCSNSCIKLELILTIDDLFTISDPLLLSPDHCNSVPSYLLILLFVRIMDGMSIDPVHS